MSYDILTSENFVKELKRLAKKYPSLKQDVEVLGESLAENPEQGSPLGRNCYKIRLAIKS
jgi:mRNA-degrading endonuclease RelE of RelBE toxin-antitoxin system